MCKNVSIVLTPFTPPCVNTIDISLHIDLDLYIHAYRYVDRWSQGGIIHRPVADLDFTRYSFTYRLLYTNPLSLYCPPTCIAHTVAILFHYYCTIFNPLPTPRFHAIHHTILCIAISCEG